MIFIAIIIQLAGLALLYRSWCTPNRKSGTNAAAWLVLITALWPWQQAVGLEYGIAFWCVTIPLIAWVFVVNNREFRNRTTPPRIRKHAWPEKKQTVHAVLKILITGPVALLASFVCASFLSAAAYRGAGLAEANHLVLNLSLLLLFWAVIIYWVTAKPLRWQSTSALLTFAIGGSFWLYG